MSGTRHNAASEEELSALKAIGDAREPVIIPADIRERLISKGLAIASETDLAITPEGMLRILTGK